MTKLNDKSLSDWNTLADSISPQSKAFINGEFVVSASGARFAVNNPATGKLLAEVSECSEEDVNRAVSAARVAFDKGDWSRITPRARKEKLLLLAELMERDSEELILLETLDVGKPISEVINYDVPESIRAIRWTAECLDKMYGEVAPTGSDVLAMSTREPLGVVAAVTPWNFPLMIACWKIGPALGIGNSVILKPAEQTPLSALKLAELVQEAGIPNGAFNVLPGYGPTVGKSLGLHPDINALAFTGSTEVGKLFMQYSAQSNMKKLGLECGGKSPNIIFADATDLKGAARAAAQAIFISQGQVCVAGSRLLVETTIIDEFTRLIVEAAKDFVPGNPLDPKTTFGAIVSSEQIERITDYVAIGCAEGAEIIHGGNQVKVENEGLFMEPTIFSKVKPKMTIATEEIFGPVLTIIPFDDEADAVRIANDSVYGLAAALWTSNLDRAHRVSSNLVAGTVWVNCYGHGDITVPFGGFKESGFGRDKSMHAFEKFSGVKTTWIALQKE